MSAAMQRGGGRPNDMAAAHKRLAELLALVPSGRLVTHKVLSTALGIDMRHTAALLLQLGDEERSRLPWHRAVADGGAIGRHLWREEQMARLRAEGVPVAPAGIAQEMAARAIASFDDIKPLPAPAQAAGGAPPAPAPSRSRGMKGRPQSSLG